MSKYIKNLIITLCFSIVIFNFSSFNISEIKNDNQPYVQEIPLSKRGKFLYTPTDKELTWRYVLEWCESRGDNLAINKMDLDGTPSYGLFQFKPETLKYYLYRYEIIPKDILDTFEKEDFINLSFDREIMYEILNRMIGEKNNIRWEKEFPACVKKFGRP